MHWTKCTDRVADTAGVVTNTSQPIFTE